LLSQNALHIGAFSHDNDKTAKQSPEAVKSLGAGDLYDIETYFRREGCTEFVYDA
jgi:hypothetical protein